LLTARPREAWYTAYPFEVAPPTDDRPFFGHFFKWSQAPQVLAELSKTWQPFGGAGYFVVVVLLVLATAMAGVLILLPVAVARFVRRPPKGSEPSGRSRWTGLTYFALIGLAFLLVEIPLIQHFILFLGQPAYALTAVLFTLLSSSGLGSQSAMRIPLRWALLALVALVLSLPALLPHLFALTLAWPLEWRLGLTVVMLAPVGFLMGIPFPCGIHELETEASSLIPWVWGVNGAASVVASALTALLALSFGFRWVLIGGAVCYAGAWITARALLPQPLPAHPGR
jgi:hypothetical protein